MQSVKSRVFKLMIRNRHILQGKLRRERFDNNTSIVEFRRQCEMWAAKYSKIPTGITLKEDTINGIKSEWIIPESANQNKVILYVHGGGYVSGSCDDHRAIISKFAKNCGVVNLLYEYRLAPENPFPAALDDSINVYRALLDMENKRENIIIAGESAGGGLVLAILLALKKENIHLPAAAIAISPWTDLTCSSDSYKTKSKVSVAPSNSWTVFSKHYVGNNSADNPLISPLFGELVGLPPIFINSGEDDELFDDGEKFYQKAKAAGVEISFRRGRGMVHCYPLLAPMFREATEAMEEICSFIKKYI